MPIQEIRRFKAWDAEGRSVTIVENRHVLKGMTPDGQPLLGKRIFRTSGGLPVRALTRDGRTFRAPTGYPPVMARVSRDAKPKARVKSAPRTTRLR